MTATLALRGVGVDLAGGRRRAAIPVLDEVDLVVAAGQVRALIGLNGAGKTSLLRVALGMLVPDRGTAKIFGEPARTAGADVWRRCGHLVETPFCYPELTARENLYAAATLRGLTGGRRTACIERVVDQLGLQPWLDRRASRLSLGTRQKLAIAAATVHSPAVLVLDEPANALDPRAVIGLRDLIRDLARNGTAVLVSSHHLDEVARVADDIDVLHNGRIIGGIDSTATDLERRFFAMILDSDARADDGDGPRTSARVARR